jgi:hypothetical protein
MKRVKNFPPDVVCVARLQVTDIDFLTMLGETFADVDIDYGMEIDVKDGRNHAQVFVERKNAKRAQKVINSTIINRIDHALLSKAHRFLYVRN